MGKGSLIVVRHRWVVGALAVTLALASGACSGSPAAESGSPSDPTSTPSGTKSAWLRGTHVVITNSSGASVQVGTATDTDDKAPETTMSTLADGQSVSATDDWNVLGATYVFARVTYDDDKTVEFQAVNAGLSYPYVDIRQGKSTEAWEGSGAPSKDEHSFTEDESWSDTVAGHTVTFKRESDDDDNKNWAVTLK